MASPIHTAVKYLKKGGLVGMPTETVYGLAGDAQNTHAIAKIYNTKGRPTFNPLIIHGHSLEQLEKWVVFSPLARTAAEHFWPGPLTLVLPRQNQCPVDLLASAGLSTLAVRIPSHPVARALLQEFDGPIAAPSANLSNQISPTTPAMVQRAFPDLFVLDGGDSPIGLESTIIGFEPDPILYRPGGMAIEKIEKVLGQPIQRHTHHTKIKAPNAPKAPGMLKKHYAPHHPIRLNVKVKKAGEVFLGFHHTVGADLNLSPSGDLEEAAANLYKMLFALDQKPSAGIAVAPIPMTGLGIAINDRLTRAQG